MSHHFETTKPLGLSQTSNRQSVVYYTIDDGCIIFIEHPRTILRRVYTIHSIMHKKKKNMKIIQFINHHFQLLFIRA